MLISNLTIQATPASLALPPLAKQPPSEATPKGAATRGDGGAHWGKAPGYNANLTKQIKKMIQKIDVQFTKIPHP